MKQNLNLNVRVEGGVGRGWECEKKRLGVWEEAQKGGGVGRIWLPCANSSA